MFVINHWKSRKWTIVCVCVFLYDVVLTDWRLIAADCMIWCLQMFIAWVAGEQTAVPKNMEQQVNALTKRIKPSCQTEENSEHSDQHGQVKSCSMWGAHALLEIENAYLREKIASINSYEARRLMRICLTICRVVFFARKGWEEMGRAE